MPNDMNPAYAKIVLLAASSLAWAGCASQKSQTRDHPPTSSAQHELASGEAHLAINELDATAGGGDTETVHTTSQETLLVVGLPGIAGDPGAPETEGYGSEGIPTNTPAHLEYLPLPAFPGEQAGPHASGDPHSLLAGTGPDSPGPPAEDLAEPEFPGPQGLAGGPDNELAGPAEPSSPAPGPLTEEKSEEPPVGFTGSPLALPFPSQAAKDIEPQEPRSDLGWPWQPMGNSTDEVDGTRTSPALDGLLSWLNNQNPTRPKDPAGLLDAFNNPSDALAWLLGRTAPGNEAPNTEEARRQAAVLDWLARLQGNSDSGANAPEAGRNLANVLDWFRQGGGPDTDTPGREDLAGATRQLAQWLGHAARADNGEEGPSGLPGAGSNAMLRWLSQGRGNPERTSPQVDSGTQFPFPFRTPVQPAVAETLAESQGPEGSNPFPALSGGVESASTGPSASLKTGARSWLQGGSTNHLPRNTGASAGQSSGMNYVAAYHWFRRAADSWETKAPPINQAASANPQPLPDLSSQQNVSEAMRWLQKASGQRKHWLHAARHEEVAPVASPAP